MDLNKSQNTITMIGILGLVIVAVLVCLQLFVLGSIYDIFSPIFIIGAIIIGMVLINYLAKSADKVFVHSLATSPRMRDIFNKNDFEQINEHFIEGKKDEYFVSVNIGEHIFIELFCDTATLSKSDVKMIENNGLIVMQCSIRRVLSGWLGRSSIYKLPSYMDEQIEIAKRYELTAIDRKSLEKDGYLSPS